MEHIYSAIQSAAEQDAAGFRDAIHSALADKISDALELKKVSIASSMFADQDASAEVEETVSDEDLQATA
jgi:phosphoribosylpyrophosphate synthetase